MLCGGFFCLPHMAIMRHFIILLRDFPNQNQTLMKKYPFEENVLYHSKIVEWLFFTNFPGSRTRCIRRLLNSYIYFVELIPSTTIDMIVHEVIVN